MKNLKSTKPIFVKDEYGWCSDVHTGKANTVNTNICLVWGSTKDELNHRVKLIVDAAKIKEQHDEMLEALKRIYAIRELLFYPVKVKEEHLGEAIAVSEAIKKIESLLKEIES